MSKVTFREWSEKISIGMVEELFRIIDNKESLPVDIKQYCKNQLLAEFVCQFMKVTVIKELTRKPEEKMTREQLYKFTEANFIDVKMTMQGAVADAFSLALSKFAKQPVEYYCQIKAVPAMGSKLSC